MSRRIEELKEAIRREHRCEPAHARSEPLREMDGKELVWEGIVEVFELKGHPVTRCCFAWFYTTAGLERHVTMLQIPPATSPHMAVRTALATGKQR